MTTTTTKNKKTEEEVDCWRFYSLYKILGFRSSAHFETRPHHSVHD